MPVSGWIAVCDPLRIETITMTLQSDERVLVGQPQGCRLPFAFESDTPHHDEPAMRQWLSIDGVLDVSLVTIDFSDVDLSDADGAQFMKRRQRPTLHTPRGGDE